MKIWQLFLVAAMVLWFSAGEQALAGTEALDWVTDSQNNTFLYGQITVLETIEGMYYAGAQFDGGGGGYTGIQHLDNNLHTALFSIWDTAPKLHAKITEADPEARLGRFGGEGEGAHVNLDGSWKLGKPYKFFLQKQPGKNPKTTDTSFYVADVSSGKWRHIATINVANDSKHEVEAFHGLCSWIENIGGDADTKRPKIVQYDLWLGANIDGLKRLTRCGGESGSGRWGQLDGQYFLEAEGTKVLFDAAFAKLEHKYGKPTFGVDGKELLPLPDKPLPAKLIEELKHLPEAPAAKSYK